MYEWEHVEIQFALSSIKSLRYHYKGIKHQFQPKSSDDFSILPITGHQNLSMILFLVITICCSNIKKFMFHK